MDRLCRIRDLQRAVHQFEANLERLYGICLNEGMTLCSLSKAGRLSCGELSDLLGLTPSNMSKVLRSVEEKEFVRRELGTADKRQMYFSLTDRGRQLLEDRNARPHYRPASKVTDASNNNPVRNPDGVAILIFFNRENIHISRRSNLRIGFEGRHIFAHPWTIRIPVIVAGVPQHGK